MLTSVGPDACSMTQSIPTLTVLPPSSDAESWSCSPSPRPPRRHHRHRLHRTRTCTMMKNKEKKTEQVDSPKQQWVEKQVKEEEQYRGGNKSADAVGEELVSESSSNGQLLLPSHSYWSRRSTTSRQSRWSLRSLLSKDSDWDSCRLVPFSPFMGLCLQGILLRIFGPVSDRAGRYDQHFLSQYRSLHIQITIYIPMSHIF